MEQLRAIYAIDHTKGDTGRGLPELLSELASLRTPDQLNVAVRVEGRPVPLSGRQQQSLFRIIGKQLFISETTVKFHVSNLMRKLEVWRRAEAVYAASKLGLI